MPAELPPIPGRSRATYTVGRRERKLFKRRHGSSLGPTSGSSRKTYKAHGHGPSGRRWPKRVLVAFAILIPLVLLAGVAGYFYVNSKLDGIHRVSVAALTAEQSGQPVDILLVGSDSTRLRHHTGGREGLRVEHDPDWATQ